MILIVTNSPNIEIIIIKLSFKGDKCYYMILIVTNSPNIEIIIIRLSFKGDKCDDDRLASIDNPSAVFIVSIVIMGNCSTIRAILTTTIWGK